MARDVLGRGREARWLVSETEAVAAGRRRTVAIRGEPGVGKTTLVTAAIDQLASRGFTVCVANALEIERRRPFVVVRRALEIGGDSRPVPESLSLLERGGGDGQGMGHELVDFPEIEFRWIDIIHDFVDTALHEQPLAVVVDDAQWADDASLHALTALHERLHDRPLLTVLSTRPTAENEALLRLLSVLRQDDLLDLGPLDDDGVAALAAQTLGRPPTDAELVRLGRAGGNPLFVKTLILAKGSGDGRDDDLPKSIRRLVTTSMHELGDDVRRLLELVAVIGTPSSLKVLATHLERPLADIVALAERALAAELLVDEPNGVTFRHDLIRAVAYDSIRPSVRAALHLSVGERMLEQGAPVGEVASHFLMGAQRGDVAAAGVLRSAATQVGRAAPAVASQLLERALELLPSDHPDHEELVVELVRSSVFSSRLDTGLELLESALASGVAPAREAELRNARTQMFFLSGQPRRAAADFDQLAKLARGTKREPVIFADAAVSAMFAVDLEQARALAGQSLALAEQSSEASAGSLAYGVLAWITSLSGDLEGGLALATQAVNVADAADGLEGHRRIPSLFLAQCLLWCDRVPEAVATIQRGRRLSLELGMGWDEPMYHALAADERIRAGAWDDALAEIDAGLRRSVEVGARFADSWLYVHRARILFGRGRHDEAGRALDEAMQGLAGAGGQGVDQVWWIRGLLMALETPADGLGILTMLWNRLDELGVRLRQFELGPDLVTVALRSGELEFAETVAIRLAELNRESPSQPAQTAAARCRALLARDRDGLDALADHYERCSLPVESLRARAEAISATPPDDAGRRDAEATVRRRLAETGAEGLSAWYLGGSPDGRDPRASTGWDSLTVSERTIVDMVGRGRTNIEIASELSISRRTVESHLYHAYPKLGLSSRIALALEAARRSAPAQP